MVASEMEEPISQEFAGVFAESNYVVTFSALFGMLDRVPTLR